MKFSIKDSIYIYWKKILWKILYMYRKKISIKRKLLRYNNFHRRILVRSLIILRSYYLDIDKVTSLFLLSIRILLAFTIANSIQRIILLNKQVGRYQCLKIFHSEYVSSLTASCPEMWEKWCIKHLLSNHCARLYPM